jgi:hypothetical protein
MAGHQWKCSQKKMFHLIERRWLVPIASNKAIQERHNFLYKDCWDSHVGNVVPSVVDIADRSMAPSDLALEDPVALAFTSEIQL